MNQQKKAQNSKVTFDVYVGHVPKEIQQVNLTEVFSKYGEISDILVRPGNGTYGYAIVKFKHRKDADKVLKEVSKIYVGNHEMELKNGKRNNHNAENGNCASTMVKTVSFADQNTSIQHMGNFMDTSFPVKDCSYLPYTVSENVFPALIMLEITCTYVEDAVTFHGYPMGRHEELQSLYLKLNSICPNLVRLLRKPAMNKVYGALYSEDNYWYRCSVIQSVIPQRPGICYVKYIDYGNTAHVSYTDMVELPEPLKNINPFAIKFYFSDLMPNPQSPSHISYLHHLVNRRMSLSALSSWNSLEYQVKKCTSNGIDVIHELVANAFAVYKYQAPIKSPTVPKKVNKSAASKSQQNQKSKKINGTSKTNKKLTEAYNGIDKHLHEINEVHDQVRNSRNSSSDESQHAQEFIPKKIIKRGSDICVETQSVVEEAKNVNNLLKVDCVISNLKLVNNIRALIPLHTNDDLINKAIDLLDSDGVIATSEDSKQRVENAYKKYNEVLKEIKGCSDQETLVNLKKERNDVRLELQLELEKFCECFDFTLLDKRKEIQETITALESNSTDWLNVYLTGIPDTTEGLLAAFNEAKEKKRSTIEIARNKTNKQHENFVKFLADLQKEFSLNIMDGNIDNTCCVNTGGKKGSWALKFEQVLTDLDVALEEERSTCTEIKGRSHISVNQYVLEKLDVPKEKIDTECELYEKYKSLYDELNYTSEMNHVFEELYTLRKNIEAYGTDYTSEENSKKPLDNLSELHSAMHREDELLVTVAKASARHFPELVQEHPELKLDECLKYYFLLKHSWNINFFPFVGNCNRIETSYVSKLAEEPVVIKELHISSGSEKMFLRKVVSWNAVRSKSLVKVKGLFHHKEGDIMYAVLPSVWETLYDKPLVPVNYKEALNVLQHILSALCDIHSRGIVHGAVHPMSILYNEGKVLLDFIYDKQSLQNKMCLNGINFQIPNCEDKYKAADMYCFGCLVLLVLFPNLSFTSTDEGVPNLSSFQSIIQDMLSAKDFTLLSQLLSVHQDTRPSSRVLLSNGFLKDLHIISDATS